MKKQYSKPEVKLELLSKSDVLLVSEETDNRYVNSREIIKDLFSIEDIL
ncbi:MAG: hypothetical protein VZR54_07870 [Ruminococcus sp.]|jgi:hypothetical protein|nr:hypothetical protein [Ruminococcus sp.]